MYYVLFAVRRCNAWEGLRAPLNSVVFVKPPASVRIGDTDSSRRIWLRLPADP